MKMKHSFVTILVVFMIPFAALPSVSADEHQTMDKTSNGRNRHLRRFEDESKLADEASVLAEEGKAVVGVPRQMRRLGKGSRRHLSSGSGSSKSSRGKSGKGKGCKGSSKSKSKGKGKGKGGSCNGGYCSCRSCTKRVLDREAGGFTCGERIEHLMENYPDVFSNGKKACRRVAGLEFPKVCGECDPDTCDGRVPITDDPEFYCGCDSCTQDIWDRDARGYSCGSRITWATIVEQEDEEDSCREVAKQYDECKRCDPARCESPQKDKNNDTNKVNVNKEDNTKPKDKDDTEEQPSVAAEITTPQEEEQEQEQEQEFFRCGCASCTMYVWDTEAPFGAGMDFTCGKRIEFMKQQGLSELEACRSVAGENNSQEFTSLCGACDPDRCVEDTGEDNAPAPAPITPAPTLPPHTPSLETETPLYCFPDYADRKRWTDVWGGLTVEVKRHPENAACGPAANQFSEDTVSLSDNDELTLRFQQLDGGWFGSEVRIVLPPEQMPYTYGHFSFSVKSVTVKDSETGAVNATNLPPSLVFGMFTWDVTDRYEVNEFWSHEVDIELSRWGNRDIMDAQFVIQPPEEPHYQRFWTGSVNNMDQGGHIYEFYWNPTNVTWNSNAGGGNQRLEYTTEQAITAGLEDRIQCLPNADIEVRMNLWNIEGTSQPMDMLDNQVVEVVVDNFSFVPSNVEGVANGSSCSKHCQCLGSSRCLNNVCTSL